MKVGIAQIAPVWLIREQTLAKIVEYVHHASKEECRLVAFGESLLPGSASGLMKKSDIPTWVPHRDVMLGVFEAPGAGALSPPAGKEGGD